MPRIARVAVPGCPLGDKPFVKRLGEALGRCLVPRKPGPKAKENDS